MALTMDSDIRYVKGVGESRAKLYHKLGIHTVGELLLHLPRRYLDLRRPFGVAGAPLGDAVAVRAMVARKGGEQRIRRGLSLFKVTAVDGGASLILTFWGSKYAVAALREGQEYLFYGRLEGTLTRREMQNPQVFPLSARGLVPVYPLTSGITSRSILGHITWVLETLGELRDPLPRELRQRYQLCDFDYAIRTIHHPGGEEETGTARHRLIFEELLALALGLAQLREGRVRGRAMPIPLVDLQPFYDALPFTLTQAQLRAIGEATGDLALARPMNRLVQGDVGSGKTVVAAACCYHAFRGGFQSAIMAPIELLAQQHYRTLSELLGPLGLRVALLTGSATPKEKRELKEALAAGAINLCVGTHALLTGDTRFHRLGLVVTDEQHRFGVGQRVALTGKGQHTHVLVMSATPIPRTLALILYGDLELSVIDQLPAGRQTIATYVIDSTKRDRAFGYIRQHLDQGLQAYIVCPLVEEPEEGQAEETPAQGLISAVAYAKELQEGAFRGYRVGLLHGKLKPKEKEAVMAAFAAGTTQLLVATTVIEVGIDVPDAVIMMVENAERFGLSQLHQLRGRVGRGEHPSSCILLSDSKAEATRRRLEVLRSTSDGFKIAEEDLKLRGPGDFFGMRQHGLPPMQIADLATDSRVLAQAQEAAAGLLAHDPNLESLPTLALRVRRMLGMVTGL